MSFCVLPMLGMLGILDPPNSSMLLILILPSVLHALDGRDVRE
jgi:hypothetical protein